jgi:nicotinate-nucleotide adenylyltransferase
MLELATAERSQFAVSRTDVDRPGPCYTVDTLELLREEWGPDPTFFFIEGTDSLADLLTWYRPQRILELCHLAVVERPGAEIDVDRLEERLPGLRSRLQWIKMPLLEISSRDLRIRLRSGQPISYLMPRAVEAYIVEHDLYRS